MALIDQLNQVSCTVADLIGSGQLGCKFNFKNLKDVRFWKKGTVTASTETYNKSYLRTQQQAGNMIPVLDVYDFTWNDPTDEVETAESTGLSATTRKGIYELTFMSRKGLYEQKIFEALEGDDIWDVQLVDDEGNELWTETSTGGAKGFSTSRVAVNPISFNKGTTSQKTGMTIQFSDSLQFNRNLTWIAAENLDYFRSEITGANQVNCTIPNAPADTDTTIVVKTMLARGGAFVSGLSALSNWVVKVNGSTVTPTGTAVADSANKTYTFTVSALSTSDTISVQLYDTGNSSSIIILNPGTDDVLYKSTEATSVVTA